ncbi:MAG: DNA adenine methylase [Dehalococcoidia bacterium]|nr:DNA adenine methylase [Dehalococcoidia bacterium]
MSKVVPFINWAGGKSQLIRQMLPYFPKISRYQRYVEPFLGGGAVFLSLGPHRAVLADYNEDLINCYRVVRDDVDTLISMLSKYIRDREHYYEVREQDPKRLDTVARAARFIYLNKTCYNGVYRVNLKGKFNVPFGNRSAKIYDEDNLRQASHALKNVELLAQSYEITLQQAMPGDFIYLDPPYHGSTRTANFAKYTCIPFSEEDHIKLAKEFERLTELGCMVMLSNSDTPLIRKLYRHHHCETLMARRYVNCNGSRRKATAELLILNYRPLAPLPNQPVGSGPQVACAASATA